ncbi:MAG: fimbrial protein [Enterobacterales bacterium]|uniref:fimbrial protein n=1 Tax=Serratia sp. (in: enterobacteria) TaxID=616 RepID=UPI003F3831DA
MNSIKALLFFLIIGECNYSWSYDILLNVSGTIIATGCTLENESESLVVDMKEINRRQFNVVGSQLPEIPFKIKLLDCAASVTGATVSFSGAVDSENTQLLALNSGGTNGIAIKILDEDKNLIPMNEASKSYVINGANAIELDFYAQYVATGEPITVGEANAIATYTVSFP